MRKTLLWIAVLMLAAPLLAQNLTDLAGKTRKGKKPAKVYTNEDLKSAKGSVTVTTLPQPKTPDDAGAGAAAGNKQEDLDSEYGTKIEAKAKEIVDLQRQHDVAVLDFNNMRNRFYAESSGPYRDNVLRQEWDKSRENMDNFKNDVARAKRELADLKDQARKNNVSPGVIRDAEEAGTNAPPEGR